MKIAIMQPYFFPYLGYFQLIQSADTFVFYDDVNFIKKGFINRNSILLNNTSHLITIPCKSVSQNSLINEIKLNLDDSSIHLFLKKIHYAYSKAPYFKEVYNLIQTCMNGDHDTIADLAISSIVAVSDYLNIVTTFKISSKEHFQSRGIEKTKRLIGISKYEGASTYINNIGGKNLYNPKDFKDESIQLRFLIPTLNIYSQFNHSFVKGLSIIDVLMFNSKSKIQEMLNDYKME